MTNTYWVIPCNINSYNVVEAFNLLKVVDWKQSNNLKKAQKGDIVFIYISKPIKAIKYKCMINKVNKSKSTIDDYQFVINGDNYLNYGNYMELRLLEEFNDDQLSFEFLKNNGLKGNIQGPSRIKNELRKYLERFEVMESDDSSLKLENLKYEEGKPVIQYGVTFERNPELRNKAIELHGTKCKVCGFDFELKYGELGKGFIEVHHIKPMYKIREEVTVNPKTDLVPLCSNCHKMIHRNKEKPLTVDQLVKTIHFYE